MKSYRSSKSTRFKSAKSAIIANDKWATMANIFERVSVQTSEIDFGYEVTGIYSIPEFLLKLQASGGVDAWSYQVKLSDAILTDGKMNQRELTEEEKKELENKKKPTLKINKKDLEAVRLEEERIEREAKEKEEKERKFNEMLGQMEPLDQFYYLKEMPTKEPWISFKERQVQITKNGEKLIEFEEDVHEAEGLILEFSFIPPPDENEKKRPKIKGINPEDVKPMHMVAWIDMSDFHTVPGVTELTVRANLQLKSTYQKRIEEYEEKTGIKELNPTNKNILEMIKENEEQNLDIVEKAKTYIYLTITLNTPIKPILPDFPLPEPIDLIKKEEKPPKVHSVEEIEKDLLRQFKIAIAAIANIYDEAIGDSAKNQLIKRDKGNILSKAKLEERENIIINFVNKFNQSGRSDLLKEKLKKYIVKIVREKYNKKDTSVKGVFKDKRDQFYSELYAYLTDTIKKATDEFVHLKKDEIHEHVLVSFAQSKKEIMNYAIRQNKEPEDKRLLRLSIENEMLDDYSKAVKYYKARLTLNQNKEAWVNYAKLCKKLEDQIEVENAIINAIVIDQENEDLNLILIFIAILYLKGKLNDAINFMNLYILKKEMKNTNCVLHALLAFLHKEKNNDLLHKKHFFAAKTFKLKELPEEVPKKSEESVDPQIALAKEKEKEKKPDPKQQQQQETNEDKNKGNPRLHPNYQKRELNIEQTDSIWFDLINLMNEYKFFEISEKLLPFINEETKNQKSFQLVKAQIYLSRKDFSKVIDQCDTVLESDPRCYLAYLIKGHAYYYTKQFSDCETNYIRAIRYKPQEIDFDLEMLIKLGKIYIDNKLWYDAKIIFQQILKLNVEHSFAWRYLGFSLTKLGEFEEAEKALTEANLLDVENPVIWAYLTLFCIAVKRKYQAIECLNELMKVNFRDLDLLRQIASGFEEIEEYNIAINLYQKMKTYDTSSYLTYKKIAEIYYAHFEEKKSEAIEILNEGIEKIVDEERVEELNDLLHIIEGKPLIDINNQGDDLNLTESVHQLKGETLFDKDEDVEGEVNPVNSDLEGESEEGIEEGEGKEGEANDEIGEVEEGEEGEKNGEENEINEGSKANYSNSRVNQDELPKRNSTKMKEDIIKRGNTKNQEEFIKRGSTKLMEDPIQRVSTKKVNDQFQKADSKIQEEVSQVKSSKSKFDEPSQIKSKNEEPSQIKSKNQSIGDLQNQSKPSIRSSDKE